jgi:hypothetical protein
MMKGNHIQTALFLIMSMILLILLTACGGGDNSTATAATTATLKINLNGDPGGKAIIGAGFTLTIPANVTPEMVNGVVAASVVTPSGAFAGSTIAPIVTYIPATGTTPGMVQIVLSSSAPAGVTTVGEVATVTLRLSGGAAPVAANFSLNNVPVTVIDTFGNTLNGMTASVAGVTLH